MNRIPKIISAFLCVCFLITLFPKFCITRTDALISYNGYKTYTMKDSKVVSTLPDKTLTYNGKTYYTTGVQGMNVGTTYIYTAKINTSTSDNIATLYRTTASSGATVEMNYYPSVNASSSSVCTTLGHANDLQAVTVDSTVYLFSATIDAERGLSRFKVSGTNYYFTGYFKLVTIAGTNIYASSIRYFKHTGGYFYFLIKYGESVYYCKIGENETGGTASNPTEVKIYRIAILDKRNAICARSSSSASTYDNLETWVGQGFFYNTSEKAIYAPYFMPDDDTIQTGIILRYYVGDVISLDNFDFETNKGTILFPTKTSFYLSSSDLGSSCTGLEIESCGFRSSQGTDGDLKMYINANGFPSSSYDAIYSLSYTSGSADDTAIAYQPSAVIYTVAYDANGGVDSGTSTSAGNFSMSSTRHVKGITTKLRPNYFTRSGYTFEGWYLYRKSDKKWMYIYNGSKKWYAKGEQPRGAYLALFSDKASVTSLTDVNSDKITCYAQWKPVSTGTKSFYIQFDANGGTGTMDDQKIVYGTSTPVSKNTFTRTGYKFCGWTVFRRSDLSWIYKTETDLKDIWFKPGEDTSGCFIKTYYDGGSVYATSSTDRDIVTFYAAWAKIDGETSPSSFKKGTSFKAGGTLKSDADLCKVTASIVSSGNKTLYTKTAEPFASSYDLSNFNSALNYASLDVGTYTYKVSATTVCGNAPSSAIITFINKSFTVTDNTIAITGALDIGITAPEYDESPASASTVTTGANYFCASIEWSPSTDKFKAGTVYGANVTLKPKDGYSFGSVSVNAAGSTALKSLKVESASVTFTALFPKTADLTLNESAGSSYAISDGILTGAAENRSVEDIKSLFEFEVKIFDADNNEMTSGTVGTGCTVSCAGKTCEVLIKAD
ncbi:MAG: InlB B-repeat-containing protein, partial [Clostridia bacterium]|nr:InlB B-repeat-containing protein [Clostridia bacterium]